MTKKVIYGFGDGNIEPSGSFDSTNTPIIKVKSLKALPNFKLGKTYEGKSLYEDNEYVADMIIKGEEGLEVIFFGKELCEYFDVLDGKVRLGASIIS